MNSLLFYTQKAIQDMRANARLNLMTILTISLCTLMMGTLILVYLNGSRLMTAWSGEGQVVVYLDPQCPPDGRIAMQKNIQELPLTGHVEFLSKEKALENLKAELPNGEEILGTLNENPLPDAFIVTLNANALPQPAPARNNERFTPSPRKIARFADHLKSLPHVTSVSYGASWFSSMAALKTIFVLSGGGVILISFLVIFFVVGNTASLSLFARQDEFTIMRLVGATERFMAYPFYISAMLQGATGSTLGIGALALIYFTLTRLFAADIESLSSIIASFLSTLSMTPTFLPPALLLILLAVGTLLGWIGSFFAVRRHLKP